MINTDGKATVANWPLKHGGRDVPVTPPSDEGRSINSLIEERDRTAKADNTAVETEATQREKIATLPEDELAEFLTGLVNADQDDVAKDMGDIKKCFTVIGTYPNGQRVFETFEAETAGAAEIAAVEWALAHSGYALYVAGVVLGDARVVA